MGDLVSVQWHSLRMKLTMRQVAVGTEGPQPRQPRNTSRAPHAFLDLPNLSPRYNSISSTLYGLNDAIIAGGRYWIGWVLEVGPIQLTLMEFTCETDTSDSNKVNHVFQEGALFSKNAVMPSCASADFA